MPSAETPPRFGIALFPEQRFLRLARRVIEEEAELFELSPETLWRDARTPDGPRREAMRELLTRAGRPCVGHGLAAALVEPDVRPEREADWAERLRVDQAAFGFSWYSEHLGFAAAGGLEATLPLPLPDTPEAVATAAARLVWLRGVLGVPVACENVAAPFRLCPPAREPELLNEVLGAAGCDLLLDLHNAFVSERTGGLSLAGWLDGLDLERVVEIHLAGGLESEPGWLPSGRRIRLDSHDEDVPEPVWVALETALPRCPRLRAVVLERHPDSLDPQRLPRWEADVRRAREVVCSRR